MRNFIQMLVAIATLAFANSGCSKRPTESVDAELPRPVSVLVLQETSPSQATMMTGSVGSWKTEEIGFEIPGRIEYVIEPDTNIEGEVSAYEGESVDEAGGLKTVPFSNGRELARIDTTSYELQVKSVEAQIDTLKKKGEALAIEIDQVVPAERKAAVAELDYAQTELNRNAPLVQSGAVTKAELNRLMANRDKADAQVLRIDATRKSKQAELASLGAQMDDLQQMLLDAQRDVDNCRLFSPFRGQVAAVHVIPGAYVTAGQRVITVQMMDPIKIDLEVSAEQSRHIGYKQSVNVRIAMRDGPPVEQDAFVYLVNPTADPNTRTFTVTLLMPNKQVSTPIPPELAGRPIVKTRDVWRLISERFNNRDIWIIETHAVQTDEQGAFLWKIVNPGAARSGGAEGRLLDVEKVRVEVGSLHLPFLGLWTFREVAIQPGQDFDVESDLVAGELVIPPEIPTPWTGGQLLFGRERWLVRPGDLVSVDVSGGESATGFYVPLNAIKETSGRYSVFAIESSAGGQIVREIEVRPLESSDTLRRIEAADGNTLSPGTQIVSQGAHFMVDGEAVVVSRVEEARP